MKLRVLPDFETVGVETQVRVTPISRTMTQPAPIRPRDALKTLRQVVTLGALAIALIHLIWPEVAIDAITLVLIAIAVIPWLAPLFKSLELPSGWKVEFQELQKSAARAEEAGLLAPKDEAPKPEYAFERIAEEDPNLALAGLRIEIEKRLIEIAQRRGIEVRNRGLGQLLRSLREHEVLDSEAQSVLADLTGLLNSAAHGASVDQRAATWALSVGPRLLKRLDDLRNVAASVAE
jgi:hypothetical protein